MMQIKKLSVVLLDLGVSALVLGGIVAPTQAAPDMGSVVVEQQPPASGSGPSIPTYQVVTPTPGTGTVVIEQQPPASGSGPSIPTYQVVVPGPNPAQNTGVGVGQELSTPGSPVTVYPTPAP
jgi:hypothetical protein